MSRTNTPAASQASQRQRRMRPTAATQSKGLDCLVLTCGRLHKSDHEVVVVRNQNARTTMLFYFVQAPRHVENWQNCQSARKSAAWRHYSGVRECVYELEPFVYWPSCARVARSGALEISISPRTVCTFPGSGRSRQRLTSQRRTTEGHRFMSGGRLHRESSPYEKYQLNERSHCKIVYQQISDLQRIKATVRLVVLRTLLERLMHSRSRQAQLR
jgi:hypothetical protein